MRNKIILVSVMFVMTASLLGWSNISKAQQTTNLGNRYSGWAWCSPVDDPDLSVCYAAESDCDGHHNTTNTSPCEYLCVRDVSSPDPSTVCSGQQFWQASICYPDGGWSSGTKSCACDGAPVNATICSGDDSGLSVDKTASTVVASCGASKCEYTCDAGYHKSGNACVADCGDGSCDGSETCSSCSQDCGVCAPTCTSFWTWSNGDPATLCTTQWTRLIDVGCSWFGEWYSGAVDCSSHTCTGTVPGYPATACNAVPPTADTPYSLVNQTACSSSNMCQYQCPIGTHINAITNSCDVDVVFACDSNSLPSYSGACGTTGIWLLSDKPYQIVSTCSPSGVDVCEAQCNVGYHKKDNGCEKDCLGCSDKTSCDGVCGGGTGTKTQECRRTDCSGTDLIGNVSCTNNAPCPASADKNWKEVRP